MTAAAEHSCTLSTAHPFAARELLRFLAARAVSGVEAVVGDTYARTLSLPGGPALIVCRLSGNDDVTATVVATDPADVEPALAIVRQILDLDADPQRSAAMRGCAPTSCSGPWSMLVRDCDRPAPPPGTSCSSEPSAASRFRSRARERRSDGSHAPTARRYRPAS